MPAPDRSATRDVLAPELTGIDAVLFDLDGVLTPTVEVHRQAWARLFEPFLAAHGADPYTDADYFAFIDGRPRYAGVRALLDARGIRLPDGDPTDGPDTQTVCGLGNRKNELFTQVLADDGMTAYPGSVRLLDALAAAGRRLAVVSSSRNAPAVLQAAGLADRFAAVVDGAVATQRGLPGKPDPATYRFAADRLGVPPERAAVVEDAESGVAAGRAGGFGLVVGVDRGAGARALLAQGADLVVTDLADLLVPAPQTDAGRSTGEPTGGHP